MTIRSFSQNMLRLGTLMGLSRAFSRFLDMAVAMNNHNRDESFRTLLVAFQKSERYLMMETYASLVLEMTGDGSGLTDVLGEFYTENVGTFRPMTPQKYYDMLPGLFRSDGSIFRVADYRCQTGRRLLAAAKFNRSLRFYGADPDITHVLMTLLNLCINGLYGEVAWYDAKTDLFYAAWGVDLNYKGRPSIRKLEDEESLFFQKRGEPGINLHKLNFNF